MNLSYNQLNKDHIGNEIKNLSYCRENHPFFNFTDEELLDKIGDHVRTWQKMRKYTYGDVEDPETFYSEVEARRQWELKKYSYSYLRKI